MKRWKLAISLAIGAAVAVPALTGVWRLAPGNWVDLTASQKERISNYLEQTNYCSARHDAEDDKTAVCQILSRQLADGGVWYPPEHITRYYLAKNFIVAVGAFGLTFVLVLVAPVVWSAYWLWLRR